MANWQYYSLPVWYVENYYLKDRRYQQKNELDPDVDWKEVGNDGGAWLAWHYVRKVNTHVRWVLDALGAEGWELAGIHKTYDKSDSGSGGVPARYVFKRPVIEA